MKLTLTAVLTSLLIVFMAGLAPGQEPSTEEHEMEPAAESREEAPPAEIPSLESPPEVDPDEKEPPPPKPRSTGYAYIGLGTIGGLMSEDSGPNRSLSAGFHLLMGMNNDHLGIELNLGTPEDNGFFGFGIHLNFLPYNEYIVTPWAGIDGYVLDILTNKDKGCFAPALGMDIRLAKGIALRLGAAKCSYTEDLSWPFAGQSVHRNLTLINLDLIFFGE